MNKEQHNAPSVTPCTGNETPKAPALSPSVVMYWYGREHAATAPDQAFRAIRSNLGLACGARFDSSLQSSSSACGIHRGQVTRKQIGDVLRLLPIIASQHCPLRLRAGKSLGPMVDKPNNQRQMARNGMTHMMHPVTQGFCSFKALPEECLTYCHSVIRIAIKRCLGTIPAQLKNRVGENLVSKTNFGANLKKNQQTLRVTYSGTMLCLFRCDLHRESCCSVCILSELDRRSPQFIRALSQTQGRDAEKDRGRDGYHSYPDGPGIPPNVALRSKRPALADSLQHAHLYFPLWISADSAMETGRA